MIGYVDVKIIEESSKAFDVVKQINELKSNLIFLDIQPPKINGIELLELLDYKPVVKFSMAYEEYANVAFEVRHFIIC